MKYSSINRIHERGIVLIVTLVLMVVMLILAMPFLFKLSAQYRSTDKSFKSLAAINLAEAGVERAIWELNHRDISTWDGDSNVRSLTISSFQTSCGADVGDITISVTAPDSDNPEIESTGQITMAAGLAISKTVRVALERDGGSSLLDFGIFGDEGIEMSGNATINSYDSRNGPYGDDNMDWNGHTGTNSTQIGCIDLNNNTKIFGDAVSGPDSEPENVIVTRNNSEIIGEKLAAHELKELPFLFPPEGLLWKGSYVLIDNLEDTIGESGEYTSFILESNAKVIITSDVTICVTGEFNMKSNTQIDILDGCSLILYLGGSFLQHSNSQINNLTQDPTKLLVLGTEDFNSGLVWDSNSTFYGAIYAPQADVLYNSNADFYGSIIGHYIELNSNGKIHFDEALKDLDLGDGAGRASKYAVKSWNEKSY